MPNDKVKIFKIADFDVNQVHRNELKELVLRVYDKIPEEYRQKMEAYWMPDHDWPSLIVCFDRILAGNTITTNGFYCNNKICFRYPLIIEMPSEVQEVLVAHELAHAYDSISSNSFDEIMRASGLQEAIKNMDVTYNCINDQYRSFLLVHNAVAKFHEENEKHGISIHEGWGFKESILRAWEKDKFESSYRVSFGTGRHEDVKSLSIGKILEHPDIVRLSSCEKGIDGILRIKSSLEGMRAYPCV